MKAVVVLRVNAHIIKEKVAKKIIQVAFLLAFKVPLWYF